MLQEYRQTVTELELVGRPRTAAVLVVVTGALVSGCMPAAVFTGARTLPEGSVEHVGFVDVPVSSFESRRPASQALRASDPSRTEIVESESTGGPHLGYGIRYGWTERIEVGANVSLGAADVNAKIGLVDGRRVALALAPRLMTPWDGLVLLDAPFVHARLPVLFTYEPVAWLDLTPRAGLGIAKGRSRPRGSTDRSSSSRTRSAKAARRRSFE